MISQKERQPNKISTGSKSLDFLLRGGLPFSSVTDVFGPAGTGKTQLAFQASMMAVLEIMRMRSENDEPPSGRKLVVAFVDCAGSFRPERIAEMAESRGLSEIKDEILRGIYSIRARDKQEQIRSCELILSNDKFSQCRLLVVDDLTANFVASTGISGAEIIERQFELSLFARKLAYISVTKRISTLVTNSVRFREGAKKETETTGDMLSMYSLFRVRFSKVGHERTALVEQPYLSENKAKFEINTQGIP